MTVGEMVRGLVRAAEFKEQEEEGKIWDDECRRALEAARARGWGKNQIGDLVDGKDSSNEIAQLAHEALKDDKYATPGPWQWFGNTKMHEVYLATIDRGRVFVMDFVRWGMKYAQPRFQVRLDGTNGVMRSVGELGDEESPLGPKFEVAYRRQFVGIGHPDAIFIAAARTREPKLAGYVLKLLDALAKMTAARDDLYAMAKEHLLNTSYPPITREAWRQRAEQSLAVGKEPT